MSDNEAADLPLDTRANPPRDERGRYINWRRRAAAAAAAAAAEAAAAGGAAASSDAPPEADAVTPADA
ncbi:MAG: hypothetical protein HOV76_30305, partial [Hamadaea sp.]|nr:hypothetical protein [Hamadaea sp.]